MDDSLNPMENQAIRSGSEAEWIKPFQSLRAAEDWGRIVEREDNHPMGG